LPHPSFVLDDAMTDGTSRERSLAGQPSLRFETELLLELLVHPLQVPLPGGRTSHADNASEEHRQQYGTSNQYEADMP